MTDNSTRTLHIVYTFSAFSGKLYMLRLLQYANPVTPCIIAQAALFTYAYVSLHMNINVCYHVCVFYKIFGLLSFGQHALTFQPPLLAIAISFINGYMATIIKLLCIFYCTIYILLLHMIRHTL